MSMYFSGSRSLAVSNLLVATLWTLMVLRCSDLAEKLEWCRDNVVECAAIAQRAGERASVVYNPVTVAEVLLNKFCQRLAEPLPAEFS